MRIFFTRRFHGSPDGGRSVKTYRPGRTYTVPGDIPADLAAAAMKTGSAKQGNHTDPLPPVTNMLDDTTTRRGKRPPDNKAHQNAPPNKSAGRLET
jgi:hypothetical protein